MLKDIKECLLSVAEPMEKITEDDVYTRGTPTGFFDFDEITGGLQPSSLITIAGRPSMGKSVLTTNIVEHVAIKCDLPVLIFSMETRAEDFILRMMSSLARINLYALQNVRLTNEDWTRLSSIFEILSEKKIFINDSSGLTPQEITEQANELAKEHGQLGLIVVDYIQLMNVETGNQYPRAAQISEITRSLKMLAKKLNVCIIAVSQLNRDPETRIDKRPLLTDLLDSGSIENDSDLVVFVYRDEVYYDNSRDKGTAEIIIAKNRNSFIAKMRLVFMPEYQCFTNFQRTL